VTISQVVVQASVQAIYYVDPVNGSDSNTGTSTTNVFKTIIKARDVVRTINGSMTGNIIVYLMNGTHTVTATLVVGAGDSGTNGYNVIYKAYATMPHILL